MKSKGFPPISKALLEELERRFPDRVPDLDKNLSLIHGQVSVVRLLRNEFDKQNKTVLESS